MESIIRLKMQKDGMRKESKSQDGGFSLCIAFQEQELRLPASGQLELRQDRLVKTGGSRS